MTIAWVFPGQGSQKLGMADSLLDLPGAKDRFICASDLLGRDLLQICNGKNESGDAIYDLNDTRNTQPAMFIVESLLVDDLRRQGREASVLAGHSLGEIVALYASDVFDAETGLYLLQKRSELMAAAGGGAMMAVLGFDRSELEELINDTEGVVIANDNSESQVVISGRPEAVNEVGSKLKCKRSVPLKVSGAFHSPLMNDAARSFCLELDKVSFNNATFPVISNVEPIPTSDGNDLKERLKKQMINGVRWRETMMAMKNSGVTNIVEIGPGNVLSGLAKRDMKQVVINQINTSKDLGY